MTDSNLIVIGISGVTCGGKSTTACELNKIVPESKIFSQDDYFLPVDDPRHVWIPELNHINFDILSSLDMEGMYRDVKNYIQQNKKKAKLVIVEGFCIFNYQPLVETFDLKYYFTLDRDECYRRRRQRIYEPPDCPGYFERCVWVEHLGQLEEVREKVRNVVYFDENTKDPVGIILKDIMDY